MSADVAAAVADFFSVADGAFYRLREKSGNEAWVEQPGDIVMAGEAAMLGAITVADVVEESAGPVPCETVVAVGVSLYLFVSAIRNKGRMEGEALHVGFINELTAYFAAHPIALATALPVAAQEIKDTVHALYEESQKEKPLCVHEQATVFFHIITNLLIIFSQYRQCDQVRKNAALN